MKPGVVFCPFHTVNLFFLFYRMGFVLHSEMCCGSKGRSFGHNHSHGSHSHGSHSNNSNSVNHRTENRSVAESAIFTQQVDDNPEQNILNEFAFPIARNNAISPQRLMSLNMQLMIVTLAMENIF